MSESSSVYKNELSLEDIKKVELDLLIQFHKICCDLGLRYSLGGGTLLGAVRHNGFIPWDDDVDVMMPRPDYDSFIEYCTKNETPFTLFSYDNVATYYFLDAKISAKETILIDDSLEVSATSLGVHIDVFPIDGLGNNEREAYTQFMKTSLKREILNTKTWSRFFRSKTHKFYYEPIRFALYILGKIYNTQKLLSDIDKINRSVDFNTAQYAGCVSGAYRSKEIMKKDVFTEYTDMLFEGNTMKAISQYDAYLKQHYGDYMKLPPEEKRISHHSFRAFWYTEDKA